MRTPLPFLAALLLTLGSASAQSFRYQSGDLLFVSDTSDMGAAVKATTGQYTHVAMIECIGDSVFVIDATQRHGVARREIGTTFAVRMPQELLAVYRMTETFDTAAVIAHAHSLLGLPYDDWFLPDNGRYYCSELIQECYGRFESRPMNWRNANGEVPDYWKQHFERLGVAVPEGVPGTNPTDLSRSALLQRVR